MKKISLLFLLSVMACSPQVTITPEEKINSTPQVLDINTATPVLTQTHSETVILDFAVSPNGDKLAVYLNTGVYLYDIKTLQRVTFYEFESDEYYSELNFHGTIYPPIDAPGALTFSPDGTKLAISNKFQDEYIQIWDLKTFEIIDYVGNYPNGNFVRELAYSPTGNELLIRSTYPSSKVQCPELGNPPEDTLTLISLFPRTSLFEKKNCNRYSVLEYYLSNSSTIYFFHFGDSSLYYLYQVDVQTGEILLSEELDVRQDGRIYDLSQDGNVFAAIDYSSLPNIIFDTILMDAKTREKLLSITGRVDFLGSENRYLISNFETNSQGQLEFHENSEFACAFDGIEYYQPYTKISSDNTTLASLTFDNRTFKNSIQIYDISGCKLVQTIPINQD